MKRNDHLIEVKRNVFLNKKDPLFLKKYLLYYPNDKQANYDFARQLDQEGRLDQALHYLHRSADLGFLPAKKWINEMKEKQIQMKQLAADAERSEKLKRIGKRLSIVALIFSIILMILLLLTHNNSESSPPESVHVAGEGNNFDQYFYFSSNNELQDHEDIFATLLFLSVVSGLEYAYDAEGKYPSHLSSMTRSHPNNRMSYIPNGFSYDQTESTFSLYFEDRSTAIEEGKTIHPMHSELLELHFYPDVNQLVLSSGNNFPIVSFDVASGENVLEFRESKVINRVVDPKGFDGIFGTRGLELENNVAIHGTNQPKLIGEYVSMGCIRMTNEDIESLYPFIPEGTPFIVKSGLPDHKPLFENGFPTPFITEHADFFEANPSEQSNQTYTWRH